LPPPIIGAVRHKSLPYHMIAKFEFTGFARTAGSASIPFWMSSLLFFYLLCTKKEIKFLQDI
jgi:hypothetical protein